MEIKYLPYRKPRLAGWVKKSTKAQLKINRSIADASVQRNEIDQRLFGCNRNLTRAEREKVLEFIKS